ncbi:MAG: DUF421 domain-containing protein [Clostridia bacterium]|nr:DUF421 domain-containing protein [Clostridia bacterium]
MASILIRTAIIYFLLTISLRLMGKRQIGELEVSELISALLISEIAAIPIDDSDIPLLNAIIPILFLFSLEIIISFIKNKREKLKRIIEGTPSYIIYKGKLLESALSDNRLSVNELMLEIRQQGFCGLEEVYYGILEQNGKISLYNTEDGKKLSHPLIIDGEISKNKLRELGYGEEWLQKQLKDNSVKTHEVFFMSINDEGTIHLVKKDKKE